MKAVWQRRSLESSSFDTTVQGAVRTQRMSEFFLEGVKVLDELRYVPFAVAMLPALIYALNLSYPRELKYTFEALQKIIMKLDGNKLSTKVQALKTLLSR